MAKTKADRIMEMAANVALSEIGAGPEITGFSDRDEARAALAALVDEAANAPADPALLALARLGAWALDHDDIYDSDRRAAGALMMDGCAPGDVSALAARLLAPDGAASEGVTG